MARVIFLNRFYWPDEPATAQLLTDLAEHLVVHGREVVVITSYPRSGGRPMAEIRKGVRVMRVRGTRWARFGLAGKAVDFATFLLGALWRLGRIARRGDTVVAMTDPPLLGIGVGWIARFRGASLFHWVQDIYPELAIELTGQRWLAFLRPWRNAAWRRATGCVTLGSDMAASLIGAGVDPRRITVIPNWGPAGLAPLPGLAAGALRAEWGLTGKFVVAYSGNLGRVHDLDPVLDVAAAAMNDSRIAFIFVGGGAQRNRLEQQVAFRHLTNVQFRPAQSRTRLAETLALGDVHLVTLRPGCEHYVFPSKLYGIAAVGRPVVFLGPQDSELARLVVAAELGLAFQRHETAALAAALSGLADDSLQCARFGAAASRFAAGGGGSLAAADRWHKLLAV